jgi:hypothetical protein
MNFFFFLLLKIKKYFLKTGKFYVCCWCWWLRQAQESLENVLIDLYKKGGRTEEQVELLKLQLWMIYQEEAFNGKPAKIARSHGRKFQVTVEKETSRMLLKPCIGNSSDRARCKQGL